MNKKFFLFLSFLLSNNLFSDPSKGSSPDDKPKKKEQVVGLHVILNPKLKDYQSSDSNFYMDTPCGGRVVIFEKPINREPATSKPMNPCSHFPEFP